MKKNNLITYAIIVTCFCFSYGLRAQPYTYAFESGNYDNFQCLLEWGYAGSNLYTETRYPYRVVNAVQDWNLKTDGSDNSVKLQDSVIAFKKAYPYDLLVIYFPAGNYTFNKTIKIERLPNNNFDIEGIILKGESASSVMFKINHWAPAIHINNASWIGIEDIGIERITQEASTENGISGGYGILLTNANECWVSGVYSHNAWKAHVTLQGHDNGQSVSNNTITGCTFDNALAHGRNGQGYGVSFDGAYQCVVDNNLFYRLRHSILFQQDAFFNVAAYNASYNPHWTEWGEEFFGYEPSDLTFHGRYNARPGPHHNLLEGNRAEQVVFDIIHGSNGYYNTFLRNFLNDSFDIVTDSGDPYSKYGYDNSDQHNQNAIGCEGLSANDRSDIDGTVLFCGEYRGGIALEYREPYEMDSRVTSYYHWWEKPAYLTDAAWPYNPSFGSFNGAEGRKVIFDANNARASVDPEGWDNYYCGPFIAKHLVLTNNQQLSDNEYKALEDIVAGPCTVKFPSITPVNFIAPESIVLQPGFETQPGAEWSATIATINCPSNRPSAAYDKEFILPQPIEIITQEKANKKVFTENGLLSVMPNPFTNHLKLRFSVVQKTEVTIVIYNSLMQSVSALVATHDAGEHEVVQELSDLPVGAYLLSFKAGGYSTARKLIKTE